MRQLPEETAAAPAPAGTPPSLWYKDAVIYQLHVRSFCDSNGDGMGDFDGLTSKLDYLASLGVTALWLLPFYPSPLRDDGYDIADYLSINPAYGTLGDFKRFLRQAHDRGIRVITELVINHTSDQHAWFQRARTAPPGSAWRDFYVWSDTTERYRDARIIFKDFESSNWAWDPVARAYYWHRFYTHQPDLNFENPAVHRAIIRALDFWLGMGVDGLRLDAVPYLYEQDGSNCENLPQTYAFLAKLRSHLDARYPDRMLLAEANQWPEDAAAYFGKGDLCHMAFHFPLMPRMFMALQMEDRFPIVDILEQTPAIPASAQWAIFLRNHDELTLEMVSEEERDYMYRFYAEDPAARINLGIRRRLAPLLHNSRRRIEIMNILLFSLPGTPIVYYGDEIGMGDNHYLGDRNGVRTPMQWSADRNAGFSSVDPQRLFLPIIISPEYHYEAVNVETQERNLSSLLWWTRRAIATRARFKAFARGDIEFIRSSNKNILSFVRRYQDQIILVAINLSRYSQSTRLDLGAYAGMVPRDVFGNSQFPVVTRLPYVLTMGFHDYYWMQLRQERALAEVAAERQIPEVKAPEDWFELFRGYHRRSAEGSLLPPYLQNRTSAGCKPLRIREVKILQSIPIELGENAALLLLLRVRYFGGTSDTVVLPLSKTTADQLETATGRNEGLVLARLAGAQDAYLYDCIHMPALHRFLFRLVARHRRMTGSFGSLSGSPGRDLRRQGIGEPVQIEPLEAGRHTATFAYDGRVFFKLFRTLEPGPNPDIELHRVCARRPAESRFAPGFYGAVEYRDRSGALYQIGLAAEYLHSTSTAWVQAVGAATDFFEAILAGDRSLAAPVPALSGAGGASAPDSRMETSVFWSSLPAIALCTARFHRLMSEQAGAPTFEPEPFSTLYQRSLYQSMQTRVKLVFGALRERHGELHPRHRPHVERVLGRQRDILALFRQLLHGRIHARKTRIHGDLRLIHLLAIGHDFRIKDFEGSLDAPIGERRLKRSPLRDVAGLLNSVHAAAHTALYRRLRFNRSVIPDLEPWANAWTAAAGSRLLQRYLAEIGDWAWIARDPTGMMVLLRIFLLEKALMSLGDFLGGGGGHIMVPLRALEFYIDTEFALPERASMPSDLAPW